MSHWGRRRSANAKAISWESSIPARSVPTTRRSSAAGENTGGKEAPCIAPSRRCALPAWRRPIHAALCGRAARNSTSRSPNADTTQSAWCGGEGRRRPCPSSVRAAACRIERPRQRHPFATQSHTRRAHRRHRFGGDPAGGIGGRARARQAGLHCRRTPRDGRSAIRPRCRAPRYQTDAADRWARCRAWPRRSRGGHRMAGADRASHRHASWPACGLAATGSSALSPACV
jgi:hypothetical protein